VRWEERVKVRALENAFKEEIAEKNVTLRSGAHTKIVAPLKNIQ
jgi:hypothetical protein